MNDTKDKPLLETYPWSFVGLTAVCWALLWLALWVGLRAMLAGLVLLRDPYQGHGLLPWLFPAQLLLWFLVMYRAQGMIRSERSPPPWMVVLCILLPATCAPTALKLMAEYGAIVDFRPENTAAFGFAHHLLQSNAPYVISILLAVIIGLLANRHLLRKKYRGVTLSNRTLVVLAWLSGGVAGTVLALVFGTAWGFLVGPVPGNVAAIRLYRRRITASLLAGDA